MAPRLEIGDTLRPIHNSEGQVIAQGVNCLADFWEWFGESVVVDDQGRPLVVYRGEHGRSEQLSVFQSRLGSLSFGSAEAAKIYAGKPNDRSIDPFAQAPRVHAAYLRMKRPVLDEKSDPYLDLSSLSPTVGRQGLIELASDFSSEIMRTNNWEENFTAFSDPLEVADFAPDRLNDLCFLSYALLDSAKWIERLKAAGFDGAIHCGSGASSFEPEYKIFSHDQAWHLSCQMIDAR